MSDLILNTPRYAVNDLGAMTFETFCRTLDTAATKRRNSLFIHGDWSSAPEYFPACLEELEKRKISAVFCTDPFAGLDVLGGLSEAEDLQVQIVLSDDLVTGELERLSRFDKVSLFLPLSSPDVSREQLDRLLEKIEGLESVDIGVGWKGRLSGPEPISDEAYAAWSESLLTVVDRIAGHAVRVQFFCGLKLCMFSRMQLGELAVKNMYWPIATCPRPFLFTPDGACRPCVRLEMPDSIDGGGVTDLNIAAEAVDAWLAPFQALCYESDVLECRCLKVASCVTGCLAHGMQEWQS